MKKKQVLRVFLFCFFYFFFGFGFFFHTRSAVDQLFLGRYQTKFIVLHCCTIFSVKQKTSWLYATSERKQSSKSNCWLIYLTERSQHSPATTTQTCSMLMHRCIQTMFRLRIMPIAGTEYTDITQASHTCLIETRFVLFYSDLNTFGIYMGISGWCRYGVGIRPPKIQFIFMFCANWCISKFFMQHVADRMLSKSQTHFDWNQHKVTAPVTWLLIIQYSHFLRLFFAISICLSVLLLVFMRLLLEIIRRGSVCQAKRVRTDCVS